MCKGKDQKEKDDYSVRTTQPLIRRSSQPPSTSEYFEAASRTAVGEEVKKERRKKKEKRVKWVLGSMVHWHSQLCNHINFRCHVGIQAVPTLPVCLCVRLLKLLIEMTICSGSRFEMVFVFFFRLFCGNLKTVSTVKGSERWTVAPSKLPQQTCRWQSWNINNWQSPSNRCQQSNMRYVSPLDLKQHMLIFGDINNVVIPSQEQRWTLRWATSFYVPASSKVGNTCLASTCCRSGLTVRAISHVSQLVLPLLVFSPSSSQPLLFLLSLLFPWGACMRLLRANAAAKLLVECYCPYDSVLRRVRLGSRWK